MASVGFRWLDILEKEFDKAFVDLDLSIGELDSDEPDVVYNVRQKLCTLSSCFAQLTHKAQTIFQNSTKIEAELIHMRAELVESKSKREALEQELHNLLLQLHSSQLGMTGSRHHSSRFEPDLNNIKRKLEDELKKSPKHNGHQTCNGELKLSPSAVEASNLRTENAQLLLENAALRNSILALNSEVYGAKLAAKYLDKELAGRIQQLQLLGREMRGDIRDKLWRQLESEILLQRHKTVVRACRRNSTVLSGGSKPPSVPSISDDNPQNFGDVRTVVVKRKAGQGLGISITGGREHGVPILISELEANGPAALSGQLYIGDAILFVNDRDLRQSCHREAVDILQQQSGDCHLQVQYIAADDSDNSLEEDGLNFRFFDDEVCTTSSSINLHPLHSSVMLNTPTAPRTPESSSHSRSDSRDYIDALNSSLENATEQPVKQSEAPIVFPCQLHIVNNNIQVLGVLEETNQMFLDNTQKPIDNSSVQTDYEVNSNVLEPKLENTDNYLYKIREGEVLKGNENEKTGGIILQKSEENLNWSTTSVLSDNLSSPMQTSTDVFLDSEVFSTDAISNDSNSPKSTDKNDEKPLLEMKRFNEYCLSHKQSNENSDQSLLDSPDSCDSSPLHRANRDYRKPSKKSKAKRNFGVKTIQSIFSRRDGYSDISSTASELGDDVILNRNKTSGIDNSDYVTSRQFEENLNVFLSDTFSPTAKKVSGGGTRNIRIGKALRLCPNGENPEFGSAESEQKKEKLLARYVYSSNSNVDGIGDPDFGTPV